MIEGRLQPSKVDVGIGEVVTSWMQCASRAHTIIDEIELDALRRRVRGGKPMLEHLGLGEVFPDGPFELREEIDSGDMRTERMSARR